MARPDAALALAPWCDMGQTVALVGSSGVGKSSLLNTLAAKAPEEAQLTGSIREADSKGRHTTTSRSLHAIAGGGWVIDTPGVRSFGLSHVTRESIIAAFPYLEALTSGGLQDVVGPTDVPSVTLITCGGDFDYVNGEYLSRMVVRATLMAPEGTPESTPEG